MGKGLGIILLIIGSTLIYFRDTGLLPEYASSGVTYTYILGVIFAILGLVMILYPTSKPRY